MSTSESKKRWKRQNLAKGEEVLEILVAEDYRVVQFSEYHFRINERLDIWPSSRKWYDTRTHRKGTYENLKKLIKEICKN